MPANLTRIDEYISKAAPFAQPILNHLRALVHNACPQVEEAWKWSFSHFLYKGEILCSMASFKEHAVFTFWKAALLADSSNILTINNRESMGHLGKLCKMEDLPPDDELIACLKAAMKLNEEGTKLQLKKPRTDHEKKELPASPFLMLALEGSNKAQACFANFNYSQRKEYVEWVNEAKTEATREKRIAQALDWIAEGKSRNWKYEKC